MRHDAQRAGAWYQPEMQKYSAFPASDAEGRTKARPPRINKTGTREKEALFRAAPVRQKEALMPNPFLPSWEYIPDGEAHVFGDRVYLYGSHDKEAGDTFCMLPYTIWSAPVDDLSNWTNKGVNYRSEQDPLCTKERPHMYAPDCVKGSDGRYYLYYCLAGKGGSGGYAGPVSVAVCDTPDGKFEFLGHVKHADGTPFNDVLLFDPAVLNDGGRIRLYVGAYFPFDKYPWLSQLFLTKIKMNMFGRSKEEVKRRWDEGIMGAFHVELEGDMLTVKGKPSRLFTTRTKGTPWQGHEFFEGSSMRKIGNTYYFVYSSQKNHELCYATSKYPDRAFTFRGTIVSNGDVGYRGRKERDRLNHTGNNHGCIENIGGQWYVFYHRQTHGTDFSRQACAERIEIRPNGTIPQVEVTTQGMDGAPLEASGEYSAVTCCNLTNGRMPHGGKNSGIPMIASSNGEQYICGIDERTYAAWKYFDLSKANALALTLRGEGELEVLLNGKRLGTIRTATKAWEERTLPVTVHEAGELRIRGVRGKSDLLKIKFSE